MVLVLFFIAGFRLTSCGHIDVFLTKEYFDYFFRLGHQHGRYVYCLLKSEYVSIFSNISGQWLSGQSWGFEHGRPGFKSSTRVLNGFVLGDTKGKFTTLCK